MLCDGSPDPTVPQEINTFISLWADEKDEDFQLVLLKSNSVLNLIEELESLIYNTPPEELPEEEVAQYQETIRKLQELPPQGFNEATEQLLKNASSLADIDTGNMQKVIKNDNVTLCIWANLNKNPRFKGYSFAEESIGFELPKQLALSSIAVRILHTVYDHLSCHSLTFLPRSRETEETNAAETIVLLSPSPELGAEENKTAAESTIGVDEEIKPDDRKSALSRLSTREEPKSVADSHEKPGEQSDKKAESHLGSTSEGRSPSPISHEEQEDDGLEEDVVDLRQFTCLGGVYYFDALALPPQCKQVNGWTMVQLLEGGLQNYPYPTESYPINSLGTSHHEKDMESLMAPPVGVYLRVPNHVVFFEEPQVARWDPESNNWRTDVITQKTYNEKERELSFKMDTFHTFTLIQESHLNMPYESWDLSPKGESEIVLTVISTFTEIQIEIKDDQCRLGAVSSPGSDLSRLIGKWMSPLSLKMAMKRTGLNFFPEEDSEKYVSVNKKNEQVETAAYREMALLSPSFSFGWSKWNLSCGFEQIVLQVKEHSKPQPLITDNWSLYMLNSQRAQRLKISESSMDFSEDLYDGSELHSTLYHMIREYASAESMERIKHSHHLFLDCVYQMLAMTKVLTFS
ncbi:dynein axonemal intermediate chain 7 [Rhinophrynus dorsalis]